MPGQASHDDLQECNVTTTASSDSANLFDRLRVDRRAGDDEPRTQKKNS
jgi:hypothetical protein